LEYINTIFKGVIKSKNNFNLNFLGNFKYDEVSEPVVKSKKEIKKSQKSQLVEQVIPNEVTLL